MEKKLKQVHDVRNENYIEHTLSEIVVMILLAVLCKYSCILSENQKY